MSKGRQQVMRCPIALMILIVSFSSQTLAQSVQDQKQNAVGAALTKWTADFNEGKAQNVCKLFSPDLLYDYRGYLSAITTMYVISLAGLAKVSNQKIHVLCEHQEILRLGRSGRCAHAPVSPSGAVSSCRAATTLKIRLRIKFFSSTVAWPQRVRRNSVDVFVLHSPRFWGA